MLSTTTTATLYSIDFGAELLTFRGTGLAYDAGGRLTAGTISQIQLDLSGSTQFLFSGASWSAPVLQSFQDQLTSAWDIAGLTAHLFQAADNINGSGGADWLGGWAGDDLIAGADGDDTLDGGAGNDTLNGGDGEDVFVSSPGVDVMIGGSGLDTLDFRLAPGSVRADMSAGGQVFDDGWGYADDIAGGISNLLGSQHDDQLRIAGNGYSFVNGHAGNDTLESTGSGPAVLLPGSGDDLVDGGSGLDIVSYEDDGHDALGPAASGIVANLVTGLVTDGWGGADTVTGAERLIGGSRADWVRGGDGGIQLIGGGGADTLLGGNGNDALVGFADMDRDSLAVIYGFGYSYASGEGGAGLDGADSLDGGAGMDTLCGNVGDDTLIGGAGNDYLRGDSGSDSLLGGADIDVAGYRFDEIAAADLLFDASQLGTTAIVTLDDGRGGIDTLDGIESVAVTAGAGNDTLTGGANADTLLGGDGDDVFRANQSGDSMRGGDGYDTLDLSESNADLWFNVSNGFVTGGPAVDHFDGMERILSGSGNDIFGGGEADNDFDAGGGDDIAFGANGDDTLRGGSGNDSLEGGAGSNALFGGAGNDTLIGTGGTSLARYDDAASGVLVNLAAGTASDGEGGIDTLTDVHGAVGSGFDDTLTGSATGNVFAGGAGDDLIDGAAGTDQIDYAGAQAAVAVVLGGTATGSAADGNGGQDTLLGIESVRGSAFDDSLRGSAWSGSEYFEGGQGADTIDGAGGRDRVVYTSAAAAVTVQLANGSAVDGHGATDVLIDIDDAVGSLRFADSLTGTTAGNRLEGLGGNDTLDGLAGADTLLGGDGDDTYLVDQANDVVAEVASGGTADLVRSVSLSYTLSVNVEQLALLGSADASGTGNASGNLITGNTGHNLLDGGDGNDVLRGGDGNDTLIGGTGADSLFGGNGNDTYHVGAGDAVSDTGTSGSTADLVRSTVSWTLGANLENLRLEGTAGISGTGNALANLMTGNAGANRLDGMDGADRLLGGDGDDTLLGHTGADSDRLEGGAGNDAYYVDLGTDLVVETSMGGTLDRVFSTATSYTLSAWVENLVLGGSASISGIGNASNNTITGNAGANLIDGGLGNDSLVGGAGNDTYVVNSSGDRITETSTLATEIDTVLSSVSWTLGSNLERLTLEGAGTMIGTGNSLANRITGNVGSSVLTGGSGNDTLNGAAGTDTLAGGLGNDVLTGGTGADTFLFNTTRSATANVDRITDFIAVDDRLLLDDAVFAGIGPVGQIAAANFRIGSRAADASDRVIYNAATGQLFFDADGSGAGAATLFATVTAGTTLTAADIWIG